MPLFLAVPQREHDRARGLAPRGDAAAKASAVSRTPAVPDALSSAPLKTRPSASRPSWSMCAPTTTTCC